MSLAGLPRARRSREMPLEKRGALVLAGTERPGGGLQRRGEGLHQNTSRIQQASRHLHRLGERALHEFIIELATAFGPVVIDRLEAYRRIDLGLLRAVGA